ncbi:helix-turn-helix domain-containing protein [Pararhizobium sp. BT-229]|uniref:helix-turn-helix domain-containing protein n=1 Tax=Pararhizobium sp. BT-229 TaxID=2986923 RepID=UPI00355813B4
MAYTVGYNDEKYFLRAFRKSVGMTPTAYRSKQTKMNAAAASASYALPQPSGSRWRARSMPRNLG